ncbi:DUF4129 domain-containing protein [Actinoplanes derwentensis]|uniref:Protein-glutamine gamma-glutamyltransferase-like C-terminal domain-containing protein n=1 Tax=Actinoplanes derwentensis TaxID=113562 RepID=A0A1H1WJU7_9ACTN|nr:DUF4129 domain-containing protein [Actinoplanes derwentensis]GID87438.1 hypothetical protein Ade03nite_63620 [Actinoplanes derwentensis]SDS96596.1 protein of unknown function [Actinoplanes derwentensis]
MRAYEELLGELFTVVPPPLMLLILLAVTALVAAGWYFFPAWIPRRLPRFTWRRQRKPRTKRIKRAKRSTEKQATSSPETVKQTRSSLADQLAGQGRYAEAIRERLRDTVADLTRAGVIDPEPGTTAAELTTDATTGRPGVGPALTGATGLFSGVWYGRAPAGPGDDQRMRELTTEVRDTLDAGEGR